MSASLVLPVGLPLVAAAVALLLRPRPALQRAVTVATCAVVAVHGGFLVSVTSSQRILTTAVGGWPPRFAIVLAADPFAALLVAVAPLLVLAAVVAAAAGGWEHPLYHPLALVLLAGAAGTFLTADLFNLFVFFEVTLIASYVLTAMGTGPGGTAATVVYIAVNLAASLLFLAGVALVYATTGTVGIAALHALPVVPTAALAAATVVVGAIAVKAALVPLGGWLPLTYPILAAPVGALFAGLLTTVGVAALYKVYAVALGGAEALRPTLLGLAVATMLVGAFGAAGRRRTGDVLAFQVVAQVGFMVLGLAIFGVAGLAAGIFFTVQDVIVKTAAFTCAGTLGHPTAPTRVAGPVVVGAFFVAALSLAGIPPTSGFFAKALLIRAAAGDGQAVAVAAAALASVVSLVAVMPLLWRFADDRGGRATQAASAAVLAAVALAVGVLPEWLLAESIEAARVLVDATAYVEAVLG